MNIKIVSENMTKHELIALMQETYKEMIKAVVDVGKGVLAVGGELHADAEAVLLDEGSQQEDLWGINLYPEKSHESRVEYTSLINIRPRQGNTSMEIKDLSLRKKIREIVDSRILWE